MKQIKMNYSPGPPSHPLTSKRGKRSGSRGSGGQIKALWPRVTSVLVVHLRAVERKTVPTGGLWLLEPRSPAGRAARSSARRRSRSSRPSRSHAGPPPAIAPATTSVPLNRFLLHVNTYYRKGEDGAAAHYPEDIFRGSRRSGGSEGNLRTSERGPLSCPRTVVCTSLGTTNPESDPQLPPRAHLPLASPPRCSSLASKPRRWGSTDPPRGRSGAQRPPPRSRRPRTRRSRARAAASWAVAAPARALPLGCASGTPAGPGPRTRWLLRGLRGGLGRPRPQERPVPAPTPATSLLTLSRASAPSFPSGHIP
ncbi:unnamed protein product [Nyctereutes procyonoides]|uniref:(raccoon dog) hypothetical protein n=1 Tax=Nyctereutes procyonoides TaxID=34880 RepID=A0A811Z6A9_NYCPR|nr:unnamed protein product [Nyctereutes procyonoides]